MDSASNPDETPAASGLGAQRLETKRCPSFTRGVLIALPFALLVWFAIFALA